MIEFVQRQESTWATVPEKHEAGTPNIAGAIGLAEAVKFLTNIQLPRIQSYELQLVEYALQELPVIEGISIYGPSNAKMRSGVISFNLKGVHPHDVAQVLADNHIAVRAGHHCCQILHREVLRVPSTVRISIAVYNTQDDINKLVSTLKSVVIKFK